MKAEYRKDCLKRDSVEREGYAGVPSVGTRVNRERDNATQDLLREILRGRNLLEATLYKGSYGYRVGRSAQQAMESVKEYAEKGYQYVVEVDLSKYFDTLNHDLLLNILRRRIKDKRMIELIKKFLKSGVMDNGVIVKTEEGSPQGGPLSPLLANIYLNEFDQEMSRRGVNIVRYADDIIVEAKSKRAAERLLESSRKYLEDKLKLKLNMEKSRVVSIYSQKFKFLGFTLGKNKTGVMISVHKQSLKKAKAKLKELTARSQGRNVRVVMNKVKVYISGWLNYYCIASIKRKMQEWNEWLQRRFRQYIWKQWKKSTTRVTNLKKLGIPEKYAYMWGNTRLGYWRVAGSAILNRSITKEKLVKAGYYELASNYELKRLKHYGI
jgi:RNA-directed DNA polymerase